MKKAIGKGWTGLFDGMGPLPSTSAAAAFDIAAVGRGGSAQQQTNPRAQDTTGDDDGDDILQAVPRFNSPMPDLFKILAARSQTQSSPAQEQPHKRVPQSAP